MRKIVKDEAMVKAMWRGDKQIKAIKDKINILNEEITIGSLAVLYSFVLLKGYAPRLPSRALFKNKVILCY
jgi:hypothetical protein